MSAFEGTWTRRAKARVGRVLKDKWKLEKLLGVGGTAAVYQARHRNGQRVAVKMLHADFSEESELRGRFVREGYIANKVQHPAALAVMDDDVDDEGSAFLVMELLEGETVEARWKRHQRKLPPHEVLVIAAQTLDVLEAAHAVNVVHRDIKPENLFLTREGKLKVLDFGIARLRESMSRIQVTQTGVAVGTPAYMAPEQARGRNELVSGQTDLWGLGATMFTLLTGRLVHEAATGNEQLLAAMLRPAPSLETRMPHAPAQVIQIVDRALAFEMADRYPSAAAMRDAVQAAYRMTAGQELPSVARLVVPLSAPDLDEATGRLGWEKSRMDSAMLPLPRRLGLALRARPRVVATVAMALLSIVLVAMTWKIATAPSSAAAQPVVMAAQPPAPTPVAVPAPPPSAPVALAPSAAPAAPADSVPAKATKDPRYGRRPGRPVPSPPPPAQNEDDDPGPMRK
jgi:eukaryotic-like serine/threonine-protein kinase